MATLTTSWQNVANSTWAPGTGFRITFYLDAKYSSQSVDGNYSWIDVRLTSYIHSGSGAGDNYYFDCSYCPTVSGTARWYLANETITSGSGQVYHNADGTKSLTLSANARISGIGMNVSMSANVSLPTIPRASSIANQTANIGQTKTISWSRASSSFTHTLRYSFGSVSNVNIGTGLATSVNWTPPNSLYQYIPNSKQGTGTLNLITYNGGTNIGNKSSTLTLKTVESNCNPVIGTTTYSDVNTTTTSITPDNSYIVAGKSTLRINLSFSTRLYSKLSSVTINGTNYTSSAVAGTVSNGTTPYTLTKDISNYSGSTITIVVTDTRGYSKTSTVTIAHYISYVQLSGSFEMKRVQPTTGEIAVRFSGDYFNSYFGTNTEDYQNSMAIKYVYKKSSESSYSSQITLDSSKYHKVGNKYYSGSTASSTSPEWISLGSIFDYRENYNFIFYYNDRIVSLSTSITVTKGIPIVNWNKTKFRVNGNLEVTGNATINGDLTVNGQKITSKIQRYVVSSAVSSYTISNIGANSYNLIRINIIPAFTSSNQGNTMVYRVNDRTSYHWESSRTYSYGKLTSEGALTTTSGDYLNRTEPFLRVFQMFPKTRNQLELYIESGHLCYFLIGGRSTSGDQRIGMYYGYTDYTTSSIDKITFYMVNSSNVQSGTIPAGTKFIVEVI